MEARGIRVGRMLQVKGIRARLVVSVKLSVQCLSCGFSQAKRAMPCRQPHPPSLEVKPSQAEAEAGAEARMRVYTIRYGTRTCRII